jgi:hypothetical protein
MNIPAALPGGASHIYGQALAGRDRATWWRAAQPMIMRGAIRHRGGDRALFSVSCFRQKFSPRPFGGLDLGGCRWMTPVALLSAWSDAVRIELVADGEGEERPDRWGVDAAQTARNARGVGLKAIPFGRTVEPIITVDELTAQNYLLELSERVDIPPFSAGYEWRDGELVGIEGYDGRMLDIPLTIDLLTRDAGGIVNRRRLDLLMIPLSPEMRPAAVCGRGSHRRVRLPAYRYVPSKRFMVRNRQKSSRAAPPHR